MSNPLPQAGHSKWRILYRTAIREQYWPSIGRRILRAEEAIALRKSELKGKHGASVQLEKEAMRDASYVLQILKTTQVSCRLCGEPVTSETPYKWSHGSPIHERCHALKSRLREATDSPIRVSPLQEVARKDHFEVAGHRTDRGTSRWL